MGGQEEMVTHGRTDIRTDRRTYGRILIDVYRRKKGRTHKRTDITFNSIIILDNLLTLINDNKLLPSQYFCKREERMIFVIFTSYLDAFAFPKHSFFCIYG